MPTFHTTIAPITPIATQITVAKRGHAVHANGAWGYPELAPLQSPAMSSETGGCSPTRRWSGSTSTRAVGSTWSAGWSLGATRFTTSCSPAAQWEQGQVFRYERWIDSPRLMAAYPAGTQPAIDEVDTWLRRRYRVAFGAPALALYRNERDSVAFHRDRELRWLDDTVIAVLTFGARRPWLLKPLGGRRNDLDDDLAGAIDFAPGSGDLLVMGGTTQARWLHAVPKVRGRCRTRISVQWRYTSRRGTRDTNPSFYAPATFQQAPRRRELRRIRGRRNLRSITAVR